MKRSSYGEQDYAFGQAMLTLRTTIRMTQEGLAAYLGVSRKAVSKWEAGGSYLHVSPRPALSSHREAFLYCCFACFCLNWRAGNRG
jgi:DNA-binding XRE family transcriptional regulator